MQTNEENPVLIVHSDLNGQVLYFFGARHTNNPDDAQFRQLDSFWDEFLKEAYGERVVMVEGVVHEVSGSKEDAIRKNGETGNAVWLAKQGNIPLVRIEPPDAQQREVLCSLFDPHVVAYSLIVQNLGAWFRHERASDFSEAVIRSISREGRFADIYGFVPEEEWFYGKHKELFNDEQVSDKDFLDAISDPRRDDTIVNRVISSRTQLRNEYIFKIIREAWEARKSIFVVYGKGHLHALEDSLKGLG